jgi:hypothetical protein
MAEALGSTVAHATPTVLMCLQTLEGAVLRFQVGGRLLG